MSKAGSNDGDKPVQSNEDDSKGIKPAKVYPTDKCKDSTDEDSDETSSESSVDMDAALVRIYGDSLPTIGADPVATAV